jgi:hypothetical protein
MGWLKIEGKDALPYVVAVAVGYLAGRFVPDPTWAIYTSVLISYHLFLVWIVISGEKEAGLSLPILTTVLTHAGCVFLAVAVTMARHYIPFFGILRFGVTAVAVFERNWLFGEARKKPLSEAAVNSALSRALDNAAPPQALANATQPQAAAKSPKVVAEIPEADPIATATGEDHEAWLRYLATRNPTHRRAGCTMNEEYKEWLRARAKSRAAAEAGAGQAIAR